jgi:hypothetical protein
VWEIVCLPFSHAIAVEKPNRVVTVGRPTDPFAEGN